MGGLYLCLTLIVLPWIRLTTCVVADDVLEIETPCPSLCTCAVTETSTLTVTCSPHYNADTLRRYLVQHSSVQELRFVDSPITSVPQELCALPHIRALDLSNNSLSNLPNGVFSCFHLLQTLILDYNDLKEISADMFSGLSALVSLHLQHNHIKNIVSEAFTRDEFTDLAKILLAYNEMTVLDTWPFHLKAFLVGKRTHVNVTFNSIHKVINTLNVSFSDITLKQSLVLDVRSNKIAHIGESDPLRLFGITNTMELLNVWNCGFLLQYNPFVCDCFMFNLVSYTKAFVKNHYKVLSDLEFIELHCAQPAAAADRLLYDIPYEAFECEISKNCPSTCQCRHHPGNETMIVNCRGHLTRLPKDLPHETYMELRIHSETISYVEPRGYMQNVTRLDLSNGHITWFSVAAAQMLRRLTELRLNANRLETLPEVMTSILSGAEHVALWGNPWKCNCSLLWLKHWIVNNSARVEDVASTTCYVGKQKIPLIHVPDEQFRCGPDYEGDAVAVGITLAVVLIVVTTGKVCYTHKDSMYLRMLRSFSGYNTVVNLERSNEDGIVLLYSESASDELISRRIERLLLQVDGESRVTLARRDAQGGMTEVDGILETIYSSKTILLLICEHFLSEPMCLWLFSTALDHVLREPNKRMLPVVLGDYDSVMRCARSERSLYLFLRQHSCLLYTHDAAELKRILSNKLQIPASMP